MDGGVGLPEVVVGGARDWSFMRTRKIHPIYSGYGYKNGYGAGVFEMGLGLGRGIIYAYSYPHRPIPIPNCFKKILR